MQKVLAAAGVGSRRQCETLITDGRVEVDRQVVTELGTRVDPAQQHIRVDGVALSQPRRVYYMLNKPPGVVSTNRDPAGRPRVVDLVRSDLRLFCVGRLDRSSEGLILCTNDGQLAFRLTHPRFSVEKRYVVQVAGRPTWEELAPLRQGVHLSDGIAKVSEIKIRRRFRQATELEIVLKEGRNREIRRLLARVGHKVLRLKRVAIGPLRLGDLPTGAHRQLAPREVQQLKRFAEGIGSRSKSAQQPSRSAGAERASTGPPERAPRRSRTRRSSGASRRRTSRQGKAGP